MADQTKLTEPAYPAHAKQAFPQDSLERIAHTIADVEHSTGAEIRVSIRDVREASEADLPLKDLAMKEFETLGMHKTAGRTGVLLLVLYDERKFYIFGDEGVHSKVHPETWNDVAAAMQTHFRKLDFEEGVHQALRRMEHHLKGKLPKKTSSDNELSDEVAIT